MLITFNSDEVFQNGFNENKLEVLKNVMKTNLVPRVYNFEKKIAAFVSFFFRFLRIFHLKMRNMFQKRNTNCVHGEKVFNGKPHNKVRQLSKKRRLSVQIIIPSHRVKPELHTRENRLQISTLQEKLWLHKMQSPPGAILA